MSFELHHGNVHVHAARGYMYIGCTLAARGYMYTWLAVGSQHLHWRKRFVYSEFVWKQGDYFSIRGQLSPDLTHFLARFDAANKDLFPTPPDSSKSANAPARSGLPAELSNSNKKVAF